MTNQVLSIDQMKRLQELGMDTSNASMEWVRETYLPGLKYEVLLKDQRTGKIYEKIPAYTLQDVLDKLPGQIGEYTLQMYYFNGWICEYVNRYTGTVLVKMEYDELIDSAHEMLVWCILNGHVNPGKEASNG